MILRRVTGTDKSVKERKGLKRKFAAYAGLTLGLILTAGLFAGCGKKDTAESGNVDVDLSIFAAKSLNSVMDEICAAYTREHPNVNFQNNYDSSGTLMAQIKEGAKCNIFSQQEWHRWMSFRMVMKQEAWLMILVLTF